MTQRRVLVFNHFAVPRGHPGGTRHVELFGRLPEWSTVLIAARRNMVTGQPQRAEPGFCPVAVTPYRGNGLGRVINWASFAVTATVAGLRQPRPDVVYASSPHLLAGLSGWFVAAVRRAPFVLEVRDLWPRVLVDMGRLTEASLVYRALERVERFLYRRAQRVVIMAPGVRAAVENKGAHPEHIAFIPNGADPEDFVPGAERDELRRRYGFTRRTVVYAGAHGPANGLDLLLDAAKAVPDLDIVLVGSGVEKSRLQAAAHGIRNVRFLDPVPKAEIPDVLHAADVGVHVLADVELFRVGVSPNKVFDYMAAALPIVTNSPGVVGDLVMTAGAGYVTAPVNLAHGLGQVAQASSEELAKMGASGRRWIQQNQSRTAMAHALGQLLVSVVDGPGAAR
ncbi:Glycosyltransferase involved in cell wall bisynthesis [Micromonospora viridifaciens]|uniref:Glycosyltransferase involved in cell wall bisynthesis n=1 Tax=Micromonospora viridifaciens TaxID=1881 RepID=A0A1C4Z5F3_MICVI|nr:glycosyltransferase family 4 protein [Micromonospora viridifaciens]SCF28173.1 Glycosyltransferase involved in cell wall bisynthesis [Micromonospora viridifaciens]